jgi:hypothetical protein
MLLRVYTGNISVKFDTLTSTKARIKMLLSYTPIHNCLLIWITTETFTSNVDKKGKLTQRNTICLLDFKLSPCFECRMLSSGLFPGVCSLNANVSEHCQFHLHSTYSPMKMGKTECSKRWGLRLFLQPNLFTYNTPHSHPQSHLIPTCLWRWNRQGVPKRWHLNYRRPGVTQKKAYDTLGLHS